MTAEQIQLLRDLVAWPSELADQSATAEAIRAAIALAEQTCKTCAHRTDRHPDYPDMESPSCLTLDWPCALMDNRCGAWTAKEKP
jgi:hypothetical protein